MLNGSFLTITQCVHVLTHVCVRVCVGQQARFLSGSKSTKPCSDWMGPWVSPWERMSFFCVGGGSESRYVRQSGGANPLPQQRAPRSPCIRITKVSFFITFTAGHTGDPGLSTTWSPKDPGSFCSVHLSFQQLSAKVTLASSSWGLDARITQDLGARLEVLCTPLPTLAITQS